ncbi:hypothetical protein TRFO_34909 [Tritrichomonas foetus]|uniref:Uncharacterized protein n=1 Tax=Tritrichomonas foetus TaxID=1144522 RepID=A0A1J4JHR7_9EUKA|nr:hypothetical protein TRFO_34909 [Tritrichomonas foetus]|eukprot:OHS98654.1 hypothetical protein TRFO_34909 [Tritrichomonas foetus]
MFLTLITLSTASVVQVCICEEKSCLSIDGCMNENILDSSQSSFTQDFTDLIGNSSDIILYYHAVSSYSKYQPKIPLKLIFDRNIDILASGKDTSPEVVVFSYTQDDDLSLMAMRIDSLNVLFTSDDTKTGVKSGIDLTLLNLELINNPTITISPQPNQATAIVYGNNFPISSLSCFTHVGIISEYPKIIVNESDYNVIIKKKEFIFNFATHNTILYYHDAKAVTFADATSFTLQKLEISYGDENYEDLVPITFANIPKVLISGKWPKASGPVPIYITRNDDELELTVKSDYVPCHFDCSYSTITIHQSAEFTGEFLSESNLYAILIKSATTGERSRNKVFFQTLKGYLSIDSPNLDISIHEYNMTWNLGFPFGMAISNEEVSTIQIDKISLPDEYSPCTLSIMENITEMVSVKTLTRVLTDSNFGTIPYFSQIEQTKILINYGHHRSHVRTGFNDETNCLSLKVTKKNSEIELGFSFTYELEEVPLLINVCSKDSKLKTCHFKGDVLDIGSLMNSSIVAYTFKFLYEHSIDYEINDKTLSEGKYDIAFEAEMIAHIVYNIANSKNYIRQISINSINIVEKSKILADEVVLQNVYSNGGENLNVHSKVINCTTLNSFGIVSQSSIYDTLYLNINNGILNVKEKGIDIKFSKGTINVTSLNKLIFYCHDDFSLSSDVIDTCETFNIEILNDVNIDVTGFSTIRNGFIIFNHYQNKIHFNYNILTNQNVFHTIGSGKISTSVDYGKQEIICVCDSDTKCRVFQGYKECTNIQNTTIDQLQSFVNNKPDSRNLLIIATDSSPTRMPLLSADSLSKKKVTFVTDFLQLDCSSNDLSTIVIDGDNTTVKPMKGNQLSIFYRLEVLNPNIQFTGFTDIEANCMNIPLHLIDSFTHIEITDQMILNQHSSMQASRPCIIDFLEDENTNDLVLNFDDSSTSNIVYSDNKIIYQDKLTFNIVHSNNIDVSINVKKRGHLNLVYNAQNMNSVVLTEIIALNSGSSSESSITFSDWPSSDITIFNIKTSLASIKSNSNIPAIFTLIGESLKDEGYLFVAIGKTVVFNNELIFTGKRTLVKFQTEISDTTTFKFVQPIYYTESSSATNKIIFASSNIVANILDIKNNKKIESIASKIHVVHTLDEKGISNMILEKSIFPHSISQIEIIGAIPSTTNYDQIKLYTENKLTFISGYYQNIMSFQSKISFYNPFDVSLLGFGNGSQIFDFRLVQSSKAELEIFLKSKDFTSLPYVIEYNPLKSMFSNTTAFVKKVDEIISTISSNIHQDTNQIILYITDKIEYEFDLSKISDFSGSFIIDGYNQKPNISLITGSSFSELQLVNIVLKEPKLTPSEIKCSLMIKNSELHAGSIDIQKCNSLSVDPESLRSIIDNKIILPNNKEITIFDAQFIIAYKDGWQIKTIVSDKVASINPDNYQSIIIKAKSPSHIDINSINALPKSKYILEDSDDGTSVIHLGTGWNQNINSNKFTINNNSPLSISTSCYPLPNAFANATSIIGNETNTNVSFVLPDVIDSSLSFDMTHVKNVTNILVHSNHLTLQKKVNITFKDNTGHLHIKNLTVIDKTRASLPSSYVSENINLYEDSSLEIDIENVNPYNLNYFWQNNNIPSFILLQRGRSVPKINISFIGNKKELHSKKYKNLLNQKEFVLVKGDFNCDEWMANTVKSEDVFTLLCSKSSLGNGRNYELILKFYEVNPPSKKYIGVIVGIVVGAVVLIAIIGISIWCIKSGKYHVIFHKYSQFASSEVISSIETPTYEIEKDFANM